MSPAPASALLPELAELLLARGTRVRMAVGGRSMAPRLRDNDIVTIEPLTGTSVHFGELVLFRNAGGALGLERGQVRATFKPAKDRLGLGLKGCIHHPRR